MKYELLYPGPFTTLKALLQQGETLKAESGAMIAMSDTIDVEGKMEGGLLKGLGRMLAGESFFFQTLAARRGPGEVLLAPKVLGDVVPVPLDGGTSYVLQKDGFFAATTGVEVATKVQNLIK